jgi:cell division protein FtsB
VRSLRFWALVNGAAVFFLVGSALFGDDGVVRHEQLREQIRSVEQLNEDLLRENDRLRAEARALRHDPAYVESVIRDELGYVRPGELVFLFPEAPAAPSP